MQAFADDDDERGRGREQTMLDYSRFVEMVSGREGTAECELGDDEAGDETVATPLDDTEGGGEAEGSDAAESVAARVAASVAKARAAAPPAAPPAAVEFNDYERECFKPAGEDELACDAWFYGEDPREEKVAVEVSAEKLAALRAEGAAAVARREQLKRAAGSNS